MPHKFPEEIAETIKQKIPPTHKMWWIRGIVLSAGLVDHKSGDDPREWIDTKVMVGDVDAPGEGYDVILEGKGYEFAEGDLVTLLGHEPIEARTISSARFLYHHNTGTYNRAYKETGESPRRWDSIVDYRNRLGCPAPVNPTIKLAKLVIFSVLGLFVAAATGLILLLPFVLLVFLVMFISSKTSILLQPKWTSGMAATKKPGIFDKANAYFKTQYVDMTGLYENIAIRLDAWVRQHPDLQTGFVVVERGAGTQGLID